MGVRSPDKRVLKKEITSERCSASADRVEWVFRGCGGLIRGVQMSMNGVNERRDVGAPSREVGSARPRKEVLSRRILRLLRVVRSNCFSGRCCGWNRSSRGRDRILKAPVGEVGRAGV